MSGGIYTTRDRTRTLDQLNDVILDGVPTEGQGLVYSNGVWTNGAVSGGASGPVFTVSGSSDDRNNGTYSRIATGVVGNYESSPGNTKYLSYLPEGEQTPTDPDASAFGIYETSLDGQYTTWIFTYQGASNPGEIIGWCSIFGTESFLTRFAPYDYLGSVVDSDNPHSATYQPDGFSFEGPGLPINSGNLIYAGGQNGVVVLNDLADVESVPGGSGEVLVWANSTKKWIARQLPLNYSVLNDLGDVNSIPSVRGVLKDVGDGTTAAWQSTPLTLDLNTDVSGANPSTNDVLTWSGSQWTPNLAPLNNRKLDDLGDVTSIPSVQGVLRDVGDGTTAAWQSTPLTLSLNTDVSNANPTTNDLLVWDGSVWVPNPAPLNNRKLDDLGDVTSIPSVQGVLKDVGDGTTAVWQSTALTLNLNTDVSNANPATNDLLTWDGSKWTPSQSQITSLQTSVTDNSNAISSLQTSVAANTEAIAGGATTLPYTPPAPSRFELSLTSLGEIPGEPSFGNGWVLFRNRLYDYSKLKSFQFTADTPYPWGKTGTTNGYRQSLNQSLFNGCAELRHAPVYYWAYEERSPTEKIFHLFPGPFNFNKATYGWSYTIGSGSAFTNDQWDLVDSSAGSSLKNSLHRANTFTCHTLSNTGRSTLPTGVGGAYPEFPLAFSLTNHPYTMTSHATAPVYQDNTWVESWGVYATYSPDGAYLLLSRDGVMWDRVATGINESIAYIYVYPFGRGLGFVMQTADTPNGLYILGLQPDPYHNVWGTNNGVVSNVCSTGRLVIWWLSYFQGDRMNYSTDGLLVQQLTGIPTRTAGPWAATVQDPFCDNPSGNLIYYSTATDVYAISDLNPAAAPVSINFVPPTSRQVVIENVPDRTMIGGKDSSGRLFRQVTVGEADVQDASLDSTNYLPSNCVLGEIGRSIETRTFAPIWASQFKSQPSPMVSFDRGVTWQRSSIALESPWAFAHSDEMFVCVGYFRPSKGVIFYSTDAVNWNVAVTDETIPIPPPGLPGITAQSACRFWFSDVYYETEHRRFVAIAQNRVGLSGDGIHWTFQPMPDDPNNPGNPPIFQALNNGWNEYLRYGNVYYTRGGLAPSGRYERILALTISASGALSFADTSLDSPRERSRTDTINGDAVNGQFSYPQWWATSLGIIATEWVPGGKLTYTYSIPRNGTQLVKSTSVANLSNAVFYNVTTGFGGIIASGINQGTADASRIYMSPDGLTWGAYGLFGTDADILGIEYAGGEQYVINVRPTPASKSEMRVAKGWLSQALELNAPAGTITSPEIGTNDSVVGDRFLVSELPTYTASINRGLLLFTTEYRSCGVKPLSVVPKTGYANIMGGGQNTPVSAPGDTPGLFITQSNNSASLSQRYGLTFGTNDPSDIPSGSLVDFELTPNTPLSATIASAAEGVFTPYTSSTSLQERVAALESAPTATADLTGFQAMKDKFESLVAHE